MGEEVNNQSIQNQPQLNQNNLNKGDNISSNEENINEKKREEKKSKKQKGEKKKNDDYLLLVYPEKAKSFRAKIENCIIEILKKNELMNEKDLVLQLIFECEAAKEYYKVTHETQYLRRILWKMAKDKIILRAKIVGDERYTWYLLPENLEKVKDKLLQK
ncbi:hypothetical protein [Sulfolobus acidocaldarius]|uniref:hypothetical protein n=1 Tax=Sulfolobus acidocaldarius TaxID=2285 RepID=UPI000B5A3667|nr:hypothetical protein [Sulfolobus acidocaldarius]